MSNVLDGLFPEEIQGSYQQVENPLPPAPELPAPVSIPGPGEATQRYDNVDKLFDDFINRPASPDASLQPYKFNYEESDASRYMQSDYFKTMGYHPEKDNETIYGNRQTFGDTMQQAFGGQMSLALSSFVDGWKGWGRLAQAIVNKDPKEIMGSPEEMEQLHKEQTEIFNKYAIFRTPESEESIFNRQFLGDLIQQSGFALGTIGQFVSEELVTMGLTAALKPLTGARAILGAVRAGVGIEEGVKDMKKAGDIWKYTTMMRQMYDGLKSAGTTLRNAARLTPIGGDLIKAARKGASGWELIGAGFNEFRRTVAEVNMALTESRMEAAGTYGELSEQLRAQTLQTKGVVSPEDEQKIKELSANASWDNFRTNSLLIAAMNRLQLDNLFRSFGSDKRMLKQVLEEGSLAAPRESLARTVTGTAARDVADQAGKIGVKKGEQLTRAYEKGFFGTFGNLGEIARDFGGKQAAWEATKSTFRNTFKWEVSEGIQEMLQDVSNDSFKKYYTELYNHNPKASFKDAVASSVEDELSSMQGWKTFLMGAVTGRLISPINFAIGKGSELMGTSSEERKAAKTSRREALTTLNGFFANPNQFAPEWIANTNVQNLTAKKMEWALNNKSKYVYEHAKDSAFAKVVSAAKKLNMVDSLTDTIREFGKHFNDREATEAFARVNSSAENQQKFSEYMNNVADQVDQFSKSYDKLFEEYGDLIQPERYDEASQPQLKLARRALHEAIEWMASSQYRAGRAAKRAIDIMDTASNIPGVGQQSYLAFRILGDDHAIMNEMALLSHEIETDQQVSSPTAEVKEKIKEKQKQLQSLQTFAVNREFFSSDGAENQKSADDMMSALANYFISKNKEGGLTTTFTQKDIGDLFFKLNDYRKLKKDEKDFMDAYALMAKPKKFLAIYARIHGALDALKIQKMEAAAKATQDAAKNNTNQANNIQNNNNPNNPNNPPPGNPANPNNPNNLPGGPANPTGPVSPSSPGDPNTPQGPVAPTSGGKITSATQSNAVNSSQNNEEEETEENANDDGDGGGPGKGPKGSPGGPGSANTNYKTGDFVYHKGKNIHYYVNGVSGDRVQLVNLDDGRVITISSDKMNDRMGRGILQKADAEDVFGDNLGKDMKIMPQSRGGLFIVHNKEEGTYSVLDKNMNTVTEDELSSAEPFQRLEDAIDFMRESLQRRARKEKEKTFEFDGVQLREGDILLDKNLKPHKVLSKKPVLVNGEPTIALKQMETEREFQVSSLQPYHFPSKAVVRRHADDKRFRMGDPQEPVKVYAHVRTKQKGNQRQLTTEEQKKFKQSVEKLKQDIKDNLAKILRTVPKEKISQGLTMKITRNNNLSTRKAKEGQEDQNDNLSLHGEPISVELFYDGKSIGFLPYYNRYQYYDTKTKKTIAAPELTLKQFAQIFDISKGQAERLLHEFKEAHRSGQAVHQLLEQELAKAGTSTLTLSGSQVKDLFDVVVSPGQYDWANEPTVKLKDFEHNKIQGNTVVLVKSRQYNKDHYEEEVTPVFEKEMPEGEKEKLLQKIQQSRFPNGNKQDAIQNMSSYVAAVELPNGQIRFLDLEVPQVSEKDLASTVKKLNAQMEKAREQNQNEEEEMGVDDIGFNDTFNNKVLGKIFIAARNKSKGTYLNLRLNAAGDLVVFFEDRKRRTKGDILVKANDETAEPFTGVDDFIQQINAAIEEYDSEQPSANKIGFTLEPKSFKQHIDRNAGFEQLGDLLVKVSSQVVKDQSLSLKTKDFVARPFEVRPQATEQKSAAESQQKKSPAGVEKRTSFTTAKGSTYQVQEDGSTVRDKAYRPEHGQAEQGVRPKSEKTFYLTKDQLHKLDLVQTQGWKEGESPVIAQLANGDLAVGIVGGERHGKFVERTRVTPKSKPAVGLFPLEIWDGGRKHHFGNEITEVSNSLVKKATETNAAEEEASDNEVEESTTPSAEVRTDADELKQLVQEQAGPIHVADLAQKLALVNFVLGLSNKQGLANWTGSKTDIQKLLAIDLEKSSLKEIKEAAQKLYNQLATQLQDLKSSKAQAKKLEKTRQEELDKAYEKLNQAGVYFNLFEDQSRQEDVLKALLHFKKLLSVTPSGNEVHNNRHGIAAYYARNQEKINRDWDMILATGLFSAQFSPKDFALLLNQLPHKTPRVQYLINVFLHDQTIKETVPKGLSLAQEIDFVHKAKDIDNYTDILGPTNYTKKDFVKDLANEEKQVTKSAKTSDQVKDFKNYTDTLLAIVDKYEAALPQLQIQTGKSVITQADLDRRRAEVISALKELHKVDENVIENPQDYGKRSSANVALSRKLDENPDIATNLNLVGHAIGRLGTRSSVDALLNIIGGQPLKGSVGRSFTDDSNGAFRTAIDDRGDFIVVSSPNRNNSQPFLDERNRVQEPYSVILNGNTEYLYDVLSKNYPEVNFIKVSELSNEKLLKAKYNAPLAAVEDSYRAPINQELLNDYVDSMMRGESLAYAQYIHFYNDYKKEIEEEFLRRVTKEQEAQVTSQQQALTQFVDRVVKGEQMSSPEDLQFYDNYKKEIEKELLARQAKEQEATVNTSASSVEVSTNAQQATSSIISSVSGNPLDLKGDKKPVWMMDGDEVAQNTRGEANSIIIAGKNGKERTVKLKEKGTGANTYLSYEGAAYKSFNDEWKFVWVPRAIEQGKYQKAIADGRMTASDAITIIQAAGLAVPNDILQLVQPTASASLAETNSSQSLQKLDGAKDSFDTNTKNFLQQLNSRPLQLVEWQEVEKGQQANINGQPEELGAGALFTFFDSDAKTQTKYFVPGNAQKMIAAVEKQLKTIPLEQSEKATAPSTQEVKPAEEQKEVVTNIPNREEERKLVEAIPYDQRTDEQHADFIKGKFVQTFTDKGLPLEQVQAAVALMEARATVASPENPAAWFRTIQDIGQGEFQEQTPRLYQLPNGNSVMGLPSSPEVIDGFYSPLEKKLLNTKANNLSATKWKELFGKGDEAQFTGLLDYLNSKKPNEQLTKQQIYDFLKNNRIQVIEIVKSENHKRIPISKAQAKSDEYRYHDLYDEKGNRLDTDEAIDAASQLFAQPSEALQPTEYAKYQLSGEKENYKEVLITLPRAPKNNRSYKKITTPVGERWAVYDENGVEQSLEYSEAAAKDKILEPVKFSSTNWTEPNILLHLRMNTRKDAAGKKLLFLEEVQSDYGQSGKKKGFKTEITREREKEIVDRLLQIQNQGYPNATTLEEHTRLSNEEAALRKELDVDTLPSAPFVTQTSAWTKFALKLALREAVKQGADKIAWTTGEQQNERYDLGKQIQSISWWQVGDGANAYGISAFDKNGKILLKEKGLSLQQIEELVGKKVSQRIKEGVGATQKLGETQYGQLEGEDLRLPGKGMKGFYGQPSEGNEGILGSVAKALIRELTGKEGALKELSLQHSPTNQHSIAITPELKAAVEQGQPLFQKNGSKAKGALETLANGRKIIHALHAPNFSTAIHEIAHIFEGELSEADKKIIQQWAGTGAKWTTKTSETFARGFERYLRDGHAPTPSLKTLFEKAKKWLEKIYRRLIGSPIEKRLSPEVRQVFDRLFQVQKIEAAAQQEVAPTAQQQAVPAVGQPQQAPPATAPTAPVSVQEKAQRPQLSPAVVSHLISEATDLRKILAAVKSSVFRELMKGKGKKNLLKLLEAVEKDARVLAVKQRMTETNSNLSALKVATAEELRTADIVHIKRFQKWVDQNLPDGLIQLKANKQQLSDLTDNMLQQGVKVGQFIADLAVVDGVEQPVGILEVGSGLPFKYHEAFHAVFRLLLSEDQVQLYLGLAKKELAGELAKENKTIQDRLTELYNSNPAYYDKLGADGLEERLYEEYLADRFDAWKMDRKVKTSNIIKQFFRLLQQLANFITRKSSRSEIEALFYEINAGKYKNAAVADNRFTQQLRQTRERQEIHKDIRFSEGEWIQDEEGRPLKIDSHLPSSKGASLIASLTANLLRRLDKEEEQDVPKMLNNLLDDYAALYDKYKDHYLQWLGEEETIDQYFLSEEELDKLHDLFTNGRQQLIDAVKERLNSIDLKYTVQQQQKTALAQEKGAQALINSRDKDASGGFDTMPKELLKYLSAMAVPITDDFGNQYLQNGEPLLEAVDVRMLYSGLQKAAANSSSVHEMLQNIRDFSRYNEQCLKFFQQFSRDIGLQLTETDYLLTQPGTEHLLRMVATEFQRNTVDVLSFKKDVSELKSKPLNPLQWEAAPDQVYTWYNAFVTIYEAPLTALNKEQKEAYIDRAVTGLRLFESHAANESITDKELEELASTISNEIKDWLGIDLHPQYLAYSLASARSEENRTPYQQELVRTYQKSRAFTADHAYGLYMDIYTERNPFHVNKDTAEVKEELTDTVPEEEEEEETPQKSGPVLFQMAYANSFFDELQRADTYQNEVGESRVTRQHADVQMAKVQQISTAFSESQGKVPTLWKGDDYFENHYLLSQPQFVQMAEQLRLALVSGMKIPEAKLVWFKDVLSGEVLKKLEQGLVYGDYSNRDFIFSLIDPYFINTEYSNPTKKAEKKKAATKTEKKKKDAVEQDQTQDGDNQKAPVEELNSFVTARHIVRVPGHSDRIYSINLPVNNTVEIYRNKLRLTEVAKKAFIEEVKREFNRILKVKKEIAKIEKERKAAEADPNYVRKTEEIKGYHSAGENGAQPTGLTLFKTGHMLGDLAAILEAAALQGKDFSKFEQAVVDKLNEFWFDEEEGALYKLIDNLLQKGIIEEGKDGDEKYVNKMLPYHIYQGFSGPKGSFNYRRDRLLNLKEGDVEFNLAQIIVNDLLNTHAFNQLLYGDPAKSSASFNEMISAAESGALQGPSAAFDKPAPSLGIQHAGLDSHLVLMEDAQTPGTQVSDAGSQDKKQEEKLEDPEAQTTNEQEATSVSQQKPGSNLQNQTWVTTKAMRYLLFGLGKLTPRLASQLDRLEEGETLSQKELEETNGIGAYLDGSNGLQFVYDDGKRHFGLSGQLLTRALTSQQDGEGTWQPQEGKEDLHQLLEKLEAYQDSKQSFAIMVPGSAVKGEKANIATSIHQVTDWNFRQLDNGFWRLAEKPVADSIQEPAPLTAQDIRTQFETVRNKLFTIEGDASDIQKAINEGRVRFNHAEFQKQAIRILESQGVDSQTLEFFSLDDKGLPRYDLNGPLTAEQYSKLFFEYLSRQFPQQAAKRDKPNQQNEQTAGKQALDEVLDQLKKDFPHLKKQLEEEQQDPDHILGKLAAFQNHNEAERITDPANNWGLPFHLLHSFGLKLRKQQGKKQKIQALKINDTEFNSYEHAQLFNPATQQFEGADKQAILSALATTLSDKEAALPAKLGLHPESVAILGNMIAMGVPLYWSLLLLQQPVIQEYYRKVTYHNSPIKMGKETREGVHNVGEELLKEKKADTDIKKPLPLTVELLQGNLVMRGRNAAEEYSVLSAFLQLKEQTEYYTALQGLLQTAGKIDRESVDLFQQYMGKLQLAADDNHFEASEVPVDLRQVLTGRNPNAAHDAVTAAHISNHKELQSLLSTIFLSRTQFFHDAGAAVLANLDLEDHEKSGFQQELNQDLAAGLGLLAYQKQLQDNNQTVRLASLTNGLLYNDIAEGKPKGFLNATEILNAIKEKLPNNYFVNKFLHGIATHIVTDDGVIKQNPYNQDGINKIEINTWLKLHRFHVEKLQDGFLELYQNKDTNYLAWALFHYLLVKDGGQLSNGSFIQFAPNFLFKDLLDATGKVNELFSRQSTDEEFIRLFGMNRQQLMNKLVSSYLSHVGNQAHIPYRNLHESSGLLRYSNSSIDPEIEDYDPDTHKAPKKGAQYIEFDFWGGLNKKGGLSKKEQKELEQNGFDFVNKNRNQLGHAQLKFLKNVQSFTLRNFAVRYGEQVSGTGVQVEFPYLIKGKFEDSGEGKQFQSVYRLVSVDGKSIQDGSGLRFINGNDPIASGTSARYEEVILTGSDAQWKGAKLLDEIPQDQGVVREPVLIREHPGFSLDGYRSATTGAEEKTKKRQPKLKDAKPLLSDFEKKFGVQIRLVEGEEQGVKFFRKGKPVPDQSTMHQMLSEFLKKNGAEQIGLAQKQPIGQEQLTVATPAPTEETNTNKTPQTKNNKSTKASNPLNTQLPAGKLNIHNGNEPFGETIKNMKDAIKGAEDDPNYQRILESMKKGLEKMKCKK